MEKDRFEWVMEGLDYDKLTFWETKFVESVERFFEKTGFLTEAQEDKLEEIYRDKGK